MHTHINICNKNLKREGYEFEREQTSEGFPGEKEEMM